MNMENSLISLSMMKDGQQATVSAVEGGLGMVEKLTAMGIRPGKQVTRFCSMYMKGPITIRIDNVQLSLGRGIADKIFVIPGGLADEDPSCR
jgi:ferrous iron transport protein A